MASDNAVTVGRYFSDLWSKGDLTVAEEIFDPDFRDHDPNSPWVKPGRDGMIELVVAYRTAFPDLTFTVERQVEAGDQVVSYWKAYGTHNGEALGLAPTGKSAEVEGISLLTLRNGKLVEQVVAWDGLGLMRQLGVLPEGL
jgi:steroid delta-isomerase-like uncharacterized protein